MDAFDPVAAPLGGTHLVEASAGTGKTFAIATLYLRMLVERGLRPGSVLVVTYTKAATAELRGRLRARIREALRALETGEAPSGTDLERLLADWKVRAQRARATLEAALRDFDEAAVHTIHGFCQRMLQEFAFESGTPFNSELVTDEAPLRDEIVRDFWVRETHDAPEPLLRRLRTRELALPALSALAMRVGGDPSLPIVPDPRDTPDRRPHAIADALAAHRRTAATTRTIWTRERDTIAALLSARQLKQNIYGAERVHERWLPALDALLKDDVAPWPDKPLPLHRLTTAGLRKGTRKGEQPPMHPFFDACDDLHNADEHLRAIIHAETRRLCLDLVGYVRRERRRRRDATQTRAFDDLQLLLHGALTRPGGRDLAATIRHRFPFALIDECQDTDPLQHAIFNRIYDSVAGDGPSGLYRIGDPKQAIFAFRGADVFTYLAAKRAIAGDARTLTVNWRSDPGLIRAVSALFMRPRHAFVLPGIIPHPVQPRPGAEDAFAGEALRFLLATDLHGANKAEVTARAIDGTAAEIAATLSSHSKIAGRSVAASDVAVLCRSNRQAIAMQEALRALGIPSVLRGDKSVFDTPEAEDVQRVARAMAAPTNPAAIRAALATPLLGVRGDELHALQHDERAWNTWTRRFERWHDLWTAHRFVRAFRQLVDECEAHPRLLGLTDGERRLTNVLHLVELLHRAETDGQRGPGQMVRWLHQMRDDAAVRGAYAGDAQQVRLESDDDAVTVVTIHKSKGLEYPIVYCPFLWENAGLFRDDARWVRFHDPSDGNRLKLDVGSSAHDTHKALAMLEALAESLRLTYVALTRAKHQCSVVWGAFGPATGSPLAYLLHQPSQAEADLTAATAARFATLDEASLRADLDALAAEVPDDVTIRPLAASGSVSFARRPIEPAAHATLHARRPARRVPTGRLVSSFSALTARDGDRHPRNDHDDTNGQPPAGSDRGTTIALHEFPAGAPAGQLIHDIMQRLDFAGSRTALTCEVGTALGRHGFAPHWRVPLADALALALDTPLPLHAGPVPLRRITRRQRLNELEFVASATRTLTPDVLATPFARHAAPSACPDYATHLRTLHFEPLSGYLRGFIDLVFLLDRRWYLIDYKSNHLGPAAGDYDPARLVRVMCDRHYVLQYHIYTLALHRYLRTRLPDYEYERHFGGILYLFLRGMAPAHPEGCGIYYDRPTHDLIAELDALLDAATGAAP